MGSLTYGNAQPDWPRCSYFAVVTTSTKNREWVSTAIRPPADGEFVLAKTKLGSVETRVTFRAKPIPRWEDANFIRQLEYYDCWRSVS